MAAGNAHADGHLHARNRGQVGDALLHLDGGVDHGIGRVERGQHLVAADPDDAPAAGLDGALDALETAVDGARGLRAAELFMQARAAGDAGGEDG